MRVEPKAIVRRLNTTCTAMLEAAVAHAAGSRYYEIVPEHMLFAIVGGMGGAAAEDSDAQALLRHAAQDVGRLRGRLARVLEQMRTGNPGRPVFAESLFQWFEDAWVLASLEFGAAELRTGHLLLMFASRGHRYAAEVHPELAALPVDALRREFDAVTAGTREAALAAPGPGPSSGSGAGGGTAPPDEQALKKFTSSYTEKARQGKIDPIFGRHAEIRQLAEILARRRKNNPIIVGEPGVGKTALVEGLARAIVEGDVPRVLRGTELLELDMGLLQAGAGVRGEFEKRLKAVIDEVKASTRSIVLFIDEAHTIVGKEHDAANLLKPALARGELRTIAATTWSEYKKYFEKDAAFARRFQPVKVDEPSEEQALTMLRGLRGTYEATHKVTIRDEALVAAVKLSHRYIAGRQLPDKAVDLLDTAATRVRIEQDAKPEPIVAHEERLAAIERELGLLEREQAEGGAVDVGRLADLQARRSGELDVLGGLRLRWEEERGILTQVERARDALRKGEGDRESALMDKRTADERLLALGSEGRLIHAEVDTDVVARVVETWTGIPAGKMRSDTIGALLSLQDRLGERVKGQASAVRVVAETLRIAAAGIQNPTTPLGVLLFVGPSGVGKTETATALAELLYGGERFMTTIAMSEFQEKHTVSRLIGSPPGYVGYGEGGVLTEAVRQRPYSVVLLDECEKAALDVMNLFYQVFDKGTLSDGEGRIVDFKNTVVILTSNLASDLVMQRASEPECTAEAIAGLIRPVLSKHFKPALLARMTIVPFLPLPPEVLREITVLKLEGLRRRLYGSHKIDAIFAPEMVDELTQRCTEAETGARNVEAILRSSLMPVLSQRLLEAFADGQEIGQVFIRGGTGGWEIELR